MMKQSKTKTMKYLVQYLNGVLFLFSSLASGASIILSDKTLEDYEGINYLNKEEDRLIVEKALREIRASDKGIGEKKVKLSDGNYVKIFIG